MYDSIIGLPDTDEDENGQEMEERSRSLVQREPSISFDSYHRNDQKEYTRHFNQVDQINQPTSVNEFDLNSISTLIMKIRTELCDFDPLTDEFFLYLPKFEAIFKKCNGAWSVIEKVLLEFLDPLGRNFILRFQR